MNDNSRFPTPVPWRIIDLGPEIKMPPRYEIWGKKEIGGEIDRLIGSVTLCVDAEFIARACNNYSMLETAREDMMKFLFWLPEEIANSEAGKKIIQQLRAAKPMPEYFHIRDNGLTD